LGHCVALCGLESFYARIGSNNKELQDFVLKIVGTATNFFSSYMSLSKSSLETTTSVVVSLDGYGSLLRTKISAKDVYQLKTHLINFKNVKSISDVYYLIEGLTTLMKSNIRVPFQIGELFIEETLLKIEVSDLLGKDADVEVKIEKVSTLDDTILENEIMKKLGNNIYSFDFKEEKDNFQSGSLNVKLSITPIKKTESLRELKINKLLKFETDTSIKNFVLNVNDKKGIITSQAVQYPNKLSPFESIKIDQVVSISFKLLNSKDKKVSPHQVFIRFSQGVHEVITFVPKSNNIYKTDIDLSKANSLFKSNSGVYKFELILGDTTLKENIIWDLGNIEFLFPFVKKEETKKEEIRHVFKIPEKKTNIKCKSSIFNFNYITFVFIYYWGIDHRTKFRFMFWIFWIFYKCIISIINPWFISNYWIILG